MGPACSVSCMRLTSSAQRSCGAATNSMRMAAPSTTLEPALLKRVKNFSFHGCICRPKGILPAGGAAVRGAPPLREEVVRPRRTIKGKESTYSPPPSTYSAPGGLRQDPGRDAE
jgi:hypothetical protein